MNEKRKRPRRVATALGLTGFMALVHKLHGEAVREILKKCDVPQPHVIEVAVRDISEDGGGAQVEIISQMSQEDKHELSDLVEGLNDSRKMGLEPLPVLLIFKGENGGRTIGIPACVRNTRSGQNVGLHIHEGSYKKFAGIAETGRKFLGAKFEELVVLEAEEAKFHMTTDSLPQETKAKVGESVVSWMAEGIGLSKEESAKFETRKRLMVIFIHFLAGKGRTEDFWSFLCYAMNRTAESFSHDKAARAAIDKLFTLKEKDEFLRVAKSEFAPKAPPQAQPPQAQPPQKAAPKAAEAPPESWGELPKPKKDYLARASEKFLVEEKTLETIIEFFLNRLLSPTDTLNVFLADNPDMMVGRKKKTTVYIWFRSACQAHRKATDDLFKQAIYETIKKRDPSLKNFRLDLTDRDDLVNGKLANSPVPGFAEIEEQFYMGMCHAIKETTLDAFNAYKEKYDQETIRKAKENAEKSVISEMSREELLARHLVDTILQLKIHNINEIKKAAMGLLGKDDYRQIVGAGGVIILHEDAFNDLNRVSGGKFGKSTLFMEADLLPMYNATEKTSNGDEVKQTFGMFVDNLKPDDLREAIITKVITRSFAWSKLYIVRAGQEALENIFEQRFFEALKVIKDNMLKSEIEDGGMA
jgi:hypothetical protein